MKSFRPWLSLDAALAFSYPDLKARLVMSITIGILSVVGFLITVVVLTDGAISVWFVIASVPLGLYAITSFFYLNAILDQVSDRVDPILRDYRDYLIYADIDSKIEVSPVAIVSLGASVFRRVGELKPLERDIYDRRVKELRDDLEENGPGTNSRVPPNLRLVPDN